MGVPYRVMRYNRKWGCPYRVMRYNSKMGVSFVGMSRYYSKTGVGEPEI